MRQIKKQPKLIGKHKILVAEKFEYLLVGLGVIYKDFPEFEITGVFKNAEEGIEMADRLQPDIVINDKNGHWGYDVDFIKSITQKYSDKIKILIFTYDYESADKCFKAGAYGIVNISIGDSINKMIDAIYLAINNRGDELCRNKDYFITKDIIIKGNKGLYFKTKTDKTVSLSETQTKNKNSENAIPFLRGKTILFVEYDEKIYKELEKLLDKTDAYIIGVKDSELTFKWIEANKDIDLIILELNLRDTTGFYIAEELSKTHKHIPIIALSTYKIKMPWYIPLPGPNDKGPQEVNLYSEPCEPEWATYRLATGNFVGKIDCPIVAEELYLLLKINLTSYMSEMFDGIC